MLHNYTPDRARAFRLDWELVHRRSPRVVVGLVSSFGPDGSLAGEPAYDLVAQAYSGLLTAHASPGDRVPVRAGGIPIADLTAGMLLSTGVLAAFVRARETGEGELVEISLLAAALAVQIQDLLWLEGERAGSRLADRALLDARAAEIAGGVAMNPYYRCFEATDGFVAVACLNVTQRRDFLVLFGLVDSTVGAPDLVPDDPAVLAEKRGLTAEIERAFAAHPVETWLGRLRAAGVPCAPVHAREGVGADPQVVASSLVGEIDQPGIGPVRLLAPLVRPGPARARAHARRRHRRRARGAAVTFEVSAELRLFADALRAAIGDWEAPREDALGVWADERDDALAARVEAAGYSGLAGPDLRGAAVAGAIELGRAVAPLCLLDEATLGAPLALRAVRATRPARSRSRCRSREKGSRSARRRRHLYPSRLSTGRERSALRSPRSFRSRRTRRTRGSRVERSDPRLPRRACRARARSRRRARAHEGAVRRSARGASGGAGEARDGRPCRRRNRARRVGVGALGTAVPAPELAWAAGGCSEVVATAQQVHGALGFALESGLHRFHRRARSTQSWAARSVRRRASARRAPGRRPDLGDRPLEPLEPSGDRPDPALEDDADVLDFRSVPVGSSRIVSSSSRMPRQYARSDSSWLTASSGSSSQRKNGRRVASLRTRRSGSSHGATGAPPRSRPP